MKVRDSAAIAQKSRITKARKILEKWAGTKAHLKLLMLGGTLRVQGTLEQLGFDDNFQFVSDSRDVYGMIFLRSWKSVVVERQGSFGNAVHLSSLIAGDNGLTLIEDHSRRPKADEMSSLLKQLRLWIKMQAKLLTAFQSDFACSYWTGTIEERSPGLFALHNKDANQTYLVDTTRCDRVKIEEVKGNTIVTLPYRAGHVRVFLSDSPHNLETWYKLLTLETTIVH
jgi:hypothetical protein